MFAAGLRAGNPEGVSDPGPAPVPGRDAAAEEVVFFDGFDGPSADPDPRFWGYVPAGAAPWQRYMSGEAGDARVEAGKLVLRARKENGTYRCGGVRTLGKIAFGPGHRIEVRARIRTPAKGAWPAVWLMPERPLYPGWPDGGEIDIMEYLNHDGFIYQTVHSHYVHRHTPAGTTGDQRTTRLDPTQFHDYAVDLTDGALIFHVDGRETFRHENLHLDDEAQMRQWPFRCGYYLILNLALGGWAGEIADGELPALMEVDHVRVVRLP